MEGEIKEGKKQTNKQKKKQKKKWSIENAFFEQGKILELLFQV